MQRAELSWRRPWLADVRGLDLAVTGSWENAGFVFRPTDYRKWDAGFELRWRCAGPFYLVGGAGVGAFDQRDTYTWALPDRGESAPVGQATYAAGTSSHTVLTAGLGLDSRDNRFYPRRGLYGEVRGRRWLSGDFADYNEGTGDARVFLPSPVGKHVLAARAWGRIVDGPAQLDNVLYLGGPESVRGYRFGSLEGDEGWLLSVEYRMPLFLMPISPKGELVGFGLHLFADAGDAWYEGDDPHGPSRSWGGGAHLNIDTLQLRFEAARTDEGDWVFEFMDRFNF
ncbi:MAG TPA: BamA/TamA family outer membrane protein [Candidatus Krumholzibacteria bacterium]|nr:BamA/TamA family outer membrane protein [Candidatus Krumholzibacteria bacterium]